MTTAQLLARVRSTTTGRLSAIGALVAGVTIATLVHALNLTSRLAQTSDSAQGFVAGHAILQGNVLLSGWHFPLDDYYFTDTIPYAALEWLVGPRPFLLALVPACVYALFVLAALLACVRPSRPTTRNLEAGAAVTLMLAAPVWIGSWDPVLFSDMHMATVSVAFIALALCARIAVSGRRSAWPTGSALFVATTVAIVSDPFSLVFAFGPALAVLTVELVLRPVTHSVRMALMWLGCGTALGLLLPSLIAFAGGFTTENDVLTGFISAPLFLRNLLAMGVGMLTLFGAKPVVTEFGLRAVLLLFVRWIVLAIVVVAVFRAARHLFGRQRGSLFDRLLCACVLTLFAACGLSAQFSRGITSLTLWTGGPPMRFVVPAVLFGTVLAARQIPDLLSEMRSLPARTVARGALVLLAALTLFGGDWLSAVEARPRWIDVNPPTLAGHWLEQHELLQGVGEYWSANLVTAMSGARVQVRTVVPLAGKLVPYVWVEDRRWYGQVPQFVIWQDANKTGVTFSAVRETYSVCQVVSVAGYRIGVLAPRGSPHISRCPG